MWGLLLQYLAFCFFFFSLHLRVICLSPFNSSSGPSAKLCSPEESSALLVFKNSMAKVDYVSFPCEQPVPKTSSWKEDSDCCSWKGVTCDRLTGHVIGLDLSSSMLHGPIRENSSLFRLHHLQRLNLACNDLSGSKIASNFSQLTRLTHLNLSLSSFFGQVPSEISHLSKLISLDLSLNDVQFDQTSFNKLSQNLTQILHLSLDTVDMSSVVPGSLMNLSSSLISLSLGYSKLQGQFPTDFFHFLSLEHLRLSLNGGLKGHLPKFNWSSPLRLLDLSYTGFSGALPDTISKLEHLNVLDLGSCNFEGSIPVSISELSTLTHLYLQDNNFSGQFPDVLGNLSKITRLDLSQNNFSGQLPSSAFNLTQLVILDFSRNLFEGHIPSQVIGLPYLHMLIMSQNFLRGSIPSWLFSLPSLYYLDLGSNRLTGHIDSFQLPGSLEFIYVGNNEIDGQVPNFISQLVSLTELDLSSNNLSGVIKSDMFSKLESIKFVDLSQNSQLSLANSNVNFTLPWLETFLFSSCRLTEFPIFLGYSKNLRTLDLSNNRISGTITKWAMKLCQKLEYLNLSQNFLTSFELIPFLSLLVLDLRSNLLQGPLMLQAPYIQLVLFSNNKLTGEIPSSLCNCGHLEILDLSTNSLSGRIPACLTKAEGNNLRTLNLNGNELEGPLPSSFADCSLLEVLDVGNNMINDTFPHSLAVLPELQVLILRSNRFYGPIDDSKTRSPFPKLRIFDISHNGFTGPLSMRVFENFEAMRQGDNNGANAKYMGQGYYQNSVVLTVKGTEIKMDRILTIFTTIDLSSNRIQEQIPEDIGKLTSLMVLNFSHNSLAGYIPSSLGNLTDLESLDLSSNQLVGKIPTRLVSLTFLSIFNVSYNQLVGHIPQGNQFDTFENDSYIGNLGLCGSPLLEKCNSDEVKDRTPTIVINEEDDNSSWIDWKFAMMGYGSGLCIGLSMGYIVFSTRKPWWFVRIVERKQLKFLRRLNGR